MSKKTKKQKKTVEEYNERDLVGVKIKGHPLWPARVEKVETINNKKRYTFRFFGTNDTSQTFAEIKYFKDFTTRDKSSQKKGFSEALSLCEQEFSAELAIDTSRSKSSHDTSSEVASPPKVERTDHDLESIDEKPDSQSIDINPSQSSTIAALSPPTEPIEQTNLTEVLDIQNDTSKSKSTKSERDIVAKLRAKLAKKLKEKEARKNQLKESKISSKVADKVVVITKNLDKFSEVAKKLTIGKSAQLAITEWKSALGIYNNTFPVLAKCITYFFTHRKMSIECRRRCHETLEKLVANLKKAKDNDKVPSNIKKEIKESLKRMKDDEMVKKFINERESGYLKLAMIERKENDAKSNSVIPRQSKLP